MYYLVETKPGANISQFKAALSRNGIKYRVDDKLPNYMALRSTRSMMEIQDKYAKYIDKIEETHTRSLIEVIELVYLRRPQAPSIKQAHPVSDQVEKPVITSPTEPKISRLEYIVHLVKTLIYRGHK